MWPLTLEFIDFAAMAYYKVGVCAFYTFYPLEHTARKRETSPSLMFVVIGLRFFLFYDRGHNLDQ